MNFIGKMRVFASNCSRKFRQEINALVGKFSYLKINNLAQAIEFLELGMVDESQRRLKIILTLWSKEEQAKYLIAIVNVLLRENDKALRYLNEIKEYKVDCAKKLINIIEQNKFEKIIETYKETYSLSDIEDEIYKIEI